MPDHIIKQDVLDGYIKEMARYAISDNRRRMVPDVKDGLKPVQRRVLYSMAELGAYSESTKKKTARIVGDCMGKYHPHSDDAICGSIRPLCNWWECKIPLANGFGNWGTFQGDGPAAMRYTEAYLSEFTTEFMRLLNKYNGIVDWNDNFDNTVKEPDYLPFMLPVLLINGASGIGVGMRMDLPPHNPHEVLQITRKLLRNPNTDVVLVPDFCMPCEIIDANWKQISNTGSGKFKARGLADIGEYKGYPAIFVRSLPQGVSTHTIEDKLESMTQKGIINQIRKIYWEGSKKEVCLVIQLKKGASPEYMLDVLYKYTALESSYSINFEAIYGIDHLRFSYKSYLELFIETAKNTLFRMYCEMYQTEMTKWHELDAYIKVIQSGEVDNIYKAIRKSSSANLDELVQWLCNKIDITDLQAGYIIKSDLGKFSKGFLKKYMDESKGCFERANKYREIILNDSLITDELDKILDYYDKKYCKPRICKVVKETDSSSIPKGTFKIVVTENNYVRKLLENDSVNTVRGDRANYILTADNNENLLLFANTGKVFKLPVYKIGLCDKNNSGVDIRTLVKGLTSDICNVMYEPDVQKAAKIKRKHYMVVTTAGNTIKKLDIEDFITVPPSGIIYTKLNPGDVVADVSIVPDGMDIVVFSGHKALRMNLAEVNNYKRNSVGVAAMKSNDPIEGMNVIYDDITHIVVVTRLGKVNRFIVEGLDRAKRAQAGSQVIKLSSKDAIAGVYGVNDSTTMRIVTTSNYYDINAKDIPLGSSVSAGTKIKEYGTERTLSSGEIVVKVKLFKQ